ncbi:MAG: aminotransferase class I/II-fold pyridoxal phosphate-dependent enzyme [Bacteroidota bacterium]
MTDIDTFRLQAHQLVDWMADYLAQTHTYPVKSQVRPGEIKAQLPAQPPSSPDSFEDLMADFERILLPGMTHWQRPGFMAYFPANGSPASLLAEMLTATLGAQCMSWETSPAAAELEEQMMDWIGRLIQIPETWAGVIQSTASDATLCAILTAREMHSKWQINERGLKEAPQYRVYSSTQTHSSIEKAIKIAGIGRGNYVKIAVDEDFAMKPDALKKAIDSDLAAGFQPLCVVHALGTTSSTAVDPLLPIAQICEDYQIFLHVDAAYAGTALLLPEFHHWMEGIEKADSFVFNPHKWMFTHFDCSAYYVKDQDALVRTFASNPEYLKTQTDQVVHNYRDWGVPLGRRFRALKLWFVLRMYGVEGIQQTLRNHIQWTKEIVAQIEVEADFELLAPVNLNLICFRYKPANVHYLESLNRLNEKILHQINQEGTVYITHTKLEGIYALRMVLGNTYLTRAFAQEAWEKIRDTARTCSLS